MINENKIILRIDVVFLHFLEWTTVSMKRSKRNFLFEFISKIEEVTLF